jgi:hypothetical protein
MQTALAEIRQAIDNDYYYIVVNDDLDETVTLVNSIAHDNGDTIQRRQPQALDCARQIAEDLAVELSENAPSVVA